MFCKLIFWFISILDIFPPSLVPNLLHIHSLFGLSLLAKTLKSLLYISKRCLHFLDCLLNLINSDQYFLRCAFFSLENFQPLCIYFCSHILLIYLLRLHSISHSCEIHLQMTSWFPLKTSHQFLDYMSNSPYILAIQKFISH